MRDYDKKAVLDVSFVCREGRNSRDHVNVCCTREAWCSITGNSSDACEVYVYGNAGASEQSCQVMYGNWESTKEMFPFVPGGANVKDAMSGLFLPPEEPAQAEMAATEQAIMWFLDAASIWGEPMRDLEKLRHVIEGCGCEVSTLTYDIELDYSC